MANRLLNQFSATFEKVVCSMFGDVTIGAVGAPTLVTGKNKGIKSIARNGAGDYTITLQDQWTRFLGCWIGFVKATVPAAPNQSIVAFTPAAAGGATVRFILYNNAGTATDPASGEELLIEINVTNSNAP